MIRSSVDLPLPLGPSSAVSAPSPTRDADVVERDEVAEALAHVAYLDRHQTAVLSASAARQQVHRQQRRERQQREHHRGRRRRRWCRSSRSGPARTAAASASGPRSGRRRRSRRRTRRARARSSARRRRPRPTGSPGSVTRQNVCHALAPSVAAACSASVPSSRSTGIVSRATNGSDTTAVASTMPGTEKITWMPCSVEPVAEPAGLAVDEHQRQADDDRRDRERQIDQHPQQRLAAERARARAAAPCRSRTPCSAAPRSRRSRSTARTRARRSAP